MNEIEAKITSDVTWNRPTWPMGENPLDIRDGRPPNIEFNVLFDEIDHFEEIREGNKKCVDQFSRKEKNAMKILGLKAPFSLAKLKEQYKVLVKRYHPDTNGGNKISEERLKGINEAYEILLKSQPLRKSV